MTLEEQLKQIYTKFYQQREVLTEAPVLNQDPATLPFDRTKAETELGKVISYLMGVPDIQEESFERVIEIIQTHYSSQPEWKELLVEYFEYLNQKEAVALEAEEEALGQEIHDFVQKLSTEE